MKEDERVIRLSACGKLSSCFCLTFSGSNIFSLFFKSYREINLGSICKAEKEHNIVVLWTENKFDKFHKVPIPDASIIQFIYLSIITRDRVRWPDNKDSLSALAVRVNSEEAFWAFCINHRDRIFYLTKATWFPCNHPRGNLKSLKCREMQVFILGAWPGDLLWDRIS